MHAQLQCIEPVVDDGEALAREHAVAACGVAA